MFLEIVCSSAVYVIAGQFVIRLGPWRDGIQTEMLKISVLAGLPEEDEEERQLRSRQLRVKLLESLLWGAASMAWPVSLWPWGKKAWRRRRASIARDRNLWKVMGKVSTCPTKISVAFRRRLTPWEIAELRKTGRSAEPIAVVGFEADDALVVLDEFVAENPHLLNGEHGDALRWLRCRDKESKDDGFHRTSWRPIETAAIELMKSGRCKMKCLECDKLFDGVEIVHEPWEAWIPATDSFHGGGSEGENFRCPNGHLLCENITVIT